MSKFVAAILFLTLTVGISFARDTPTQVINWPETGPIVVRVTLGKFKELSSISSQRNYVIETRAENLWNKKISHLGFNLYLYDKNRVRIGDGWITLDNIDPGQTVKFETTVHTVGTPVSVELIPNSVPSELRPLAPPKKVSITVNSRREPVSRWSSGWHYAQARSADGWKAQFGVR